ncbi:hypothetical protein AGMB00912_02083 [Lactiplantibacillus argentoratensis]
MRFSRGRVIINWIGKYKYRHAWWLRATMCDVLEESEMRKLNIIESIIIVLGLLVFWLGSEVAVIKQQLPWLQFAGLIVVFVTGLADAIYRVVTKRSFFK